LPPEMSRVLPGTLFDYDMQCKFIFGPNSTHCPDSVWKMWFFCNLETSFKRFIWYQKDETCSKLWCSLNNGKGNCHSSNTVAEGTLCHSLVYKI
jgi:hypothetical protein